MFTRVRCVWGDCIVSGELDVVWVLSNGGRLAIILCMVQCPAGEVYDGGCRIVRAGRGIRRSGDDDGFVFLASDYRRIVSSGGGIVTASDYLEESV